MSGSPSLAGRRSRAGRVLRFALYGFVACLAISFFGFLGFVYSLDRFEQKPETRADGIVALTGGAQRIGDAIDLLAQGYARRLLISGVNEKTSRDEIFRLNPGQRRLFDCCVDLDYRARNTIGNAIETRRWAEQNQFDALIVVTSNYHMPRTLVELDHALPNLQKIPYPVAATIDPHEWWHNPSTARVLFSEYVKFLAVWVRTRFEKDPEHSSVAKIMSGGKPIQHVAAEPLWR
ncbi:YdcF family protein [Microvirga sp. 2TAF3]|uniref:YdcF family protein n=1 Tax=Microvirga sp. 2TAF3 TaxID=3233014 RepID=UPI003F989687